MHVKGLYLYSLQGMSDRRSRSFFPAIAIGDHHLVKRSQDNRDRKIHRSKSQKPRSFFLAIEKIEIMSFA